MSDELDDSSKVQERRTSIFDRGTGDAGVVDPDLALISDYLADVLSFDEQALVERRMKDDEAFFEKVWPLVRAWQQTGELPVRTATEFSSCGSLTTVFTETIPAAPSMFWTVTAGFPGMKRPRWRVTARAVVSTPPPGA